MVFDFVDMKIKIGFGFNRKSVTLSLTRKLQQTVEQHLPDFTNGRIDKSSKRISPPMEAKLKGNQMLFLENGLYMFIIT